MKVVTLNEYIGKVGNQVAGEEKRKQALENVYKENKVIDKIFHPKSGDFMFIVEPKEMSKK